MINALYARDSRRIIYYDNCTLLQSLQDNNVPLLANAEYKSEAVVCSYDGTLKHPLTGNSRRYVLGDRFHNVSNPHKSPLCEYHDINLLLQTNTIKTSYQECENN